MSWSTAQALSKLTMPQLLLVRAKSHPKHVAMRYKHLGIWNELTWSEIALTVQWAALGLVSLGFKKGDKLAIIADNIPAWPLMELAVHSLRGVCVGIYASSVKEEVNYFLDYCDISFAFCENQEQSDKVAEASSFSNIKTLIVEDPRGMRHELQQANYLTWEALLEKGKSQDPKRFEQLVAEGDAEDICTFGTTSGTTGKPKAVMLCHRNYLEMAYHTAEHEGFRPGDDYLSYLPYAWITEQFYGIAISLFCGVVINFPESADTAMSDLKEIGPHHMIGAPRVWEGVQSQVWVRIDEAYGFNRWFYKRMLAIGQKAADYRMKGQAMPLGLSLSYKIASFSLFRPLKDVLGFLRLKRAYTGGAALGPETLRFFQAIGINLKQLYGQTEAGITVYQPNGDVRHETVGKPLSGMDVKISPEGEVLVKSPGICKGYYKREETFKEALNADGYFRSGDAGYFTADGHLVIIDRISDVMHTTSGEMFSPQFIENKLKFSPYIKEAVVYGNNKDYITAMLNIDPLTVGKWAEDRGISYTTYMDLSQNPQVAKLILGEVNEVNRKLKNHEQIHRLVLLYKLLDADDEELTRTGKVRRGFIAERYKAILEGLYDRSLKRLNIMTDFKYQDGQVTKIQTDVAILEPEVMGSSAKAA